ncbi:MAG: ribosome maturation factor RimM [Hyphomonadaceae bacterium]|nr:ribosome maturation factor RimM [Hyphomonadaceae bacterium]
MSKSEKDDLIVVGALAGAHGVRGDVRVKSFTQVPEDVFSFGPLLGEDGAVLLEAKSARPAKALFIVMPKAPRQREEWDAMKGTRLYVPRSALPEPEEDEVYVDDLVGLAVVAPDGTALGKVKAVQNFGAGDLLEIAPAGGGGAVYIPFSEEDVPEVDLETGRLVVASWQLWAGGDEADDA